MIGNILDKHWWLFPVGFVTLIIGFVVVIVLIVGVEENPCTQGNAKTGYEYWSGELTDESGDVIVVCKDGEKQ